MEGRLTGERRGGPAVLLLEDGQIYRGRALAASGRAFGEVVFNTALSGYQEVLTDPSYAGQLVCMTCPMIGNYGVNRADVESARPQVAGFIVKEASRQWSNWRAEEGIHVYLEAHGIVAIEGIDTRAVTRHIREAGVMRGAIAHGIADQEELLEEVRSSPPMLGRDLVREVSCARAYRIEEILDQLFPGKETDRRGLAWGPNRPEEVTERVGYSVVAMDFGIKYNILRHLAALGCQVTVLPGSSSAEAILSQEPDALFLSNGPGDPAAVSYAVSAIATVIEERPELPTFGICLGHQLLARALGGSTYKLKFGHRGTNHPVKDLTTGRVEITTHNHGFAVTGGERRGEWVIEGVPQVEVTHINLNDGTIEGFRHRERPLLSVQFHPEAHPGPHDANHLFKRFIEMIEQVKRN